MTLSWSILIVGGWMIKSRFMTIMMRDCRTTVAGERLWRAKYNHFFNIMQSFLSQYLSLYAYLYSFDYVA
jgi:hypothetical protein